MKTSILHRIILLFLAILIGEYETQAQSTKEIICGFKIEEREYKELSDPNSLMNQRIKFISKIPKKELINIRKVKLKEGDFRIIRIEGIQNESSDKDTRQIPVTAHILQKSDGSGGISRADLSASFERANEHYSEIGFEFVMCNVNCIESNELYNENYDSDDECSTGDTAASCSSSSSLTLDVSTRNFPNTLNIYFVPNSNTSWTWRPNTNDLTQHVIMNNGQAKNESTLTHEIGHWFNLLHTHGATDATNELVDGSNCATAGDLICDTSADPNLSGEVDSSCNYTGTIVDANGDFYNPDPNNFMSYSTKPCRIKFSNDQADRILDAYLGIEDDRGYEFGLCSKPDNCKKSCKDERKAAKRICKTLKTDFKNCKKEARQAKKRCKKNCKSAKKTAIKSCKDNFRGKQRRRCKKSARQTFRTCKKSCRTAKSNAFSACKEKKKEYKNCKKRANKDYKCCKKKCPKKKFLGIFKL